MFLDYSKTSVPIWKILLLFIMVDRSEGYTYDPGEIEGTLHILHSYFQAHWLPLKSVLPFLHNNNYTIQPSPYQLLIDMY